MDGKLRETEAGMSAGDSMGMSDGDSRWSSGGSDEKRARRGRGLGSMEAREASGPSFFFPPCA